MFTNDGPVVVEVYGAGTVHGYSTANGKLIFQSNADLEVDGNVDIDLSVADLQAGIQALVDLPSKEFSASANGFLLVWVVKDIASAEGGVPSLGVAACGSSFDVNAGLSYPVGGLLSVLGGPRRRRGSPNVIQPMSAAVDGRAPVILPRVSGGGRADRLSGTVRGDRGRTGWRRPDLGLAHVPVANRRRLSFSAWSIIGGPRCLPGAER